MDTLSRIAESPEVTTDSDTGETLYVPPGRHYRGSRLHKMASSRREREDWDREVKAPWLSRIESTLKTILGS